MHLSHNLKRAVLLVGSFFLSGGKIMKCKILHESRGRIRVHLMCKRMTLHDADILEYYMRNIDGVTSVKVYDRTQDAIILYKTERKNIIRAFGRIFFLKPQRLLSLFLNIPQDNFTEILKIGLFFTTVSHIATKLFLPVPIRTALTLFRSIKYIKKGLKALLNRKLSVSVLDATAVSVSIIRGDFSTASSVMFMLNLGEILEDWTHKKSVADLASTMSLNVDKVWLKTDTCEVLVPIGDIQAGDKIVVRTGNMIPLDGKVVSGEATVNQSSMTGESLPVVKTVGSYVYAGTVAEEGECVICVDKASGSGKYDRIVRMIEESEKLKSVAEDKASSLADKLVPYMLGGTILTYLLTRNVTKAMAVLMVDFFLCIKACYAYCGIICNA